MHFNKQSWSQLASTIMPGSPEGSILGADESVRQVAAEIAADYTAGHADFGNLCGFAHRHEFEMDVLAVPGGHIALAVIPTVGGVVERVTATGKGFGPARAIASCLGEAIEYIDWTYLPSPEIPLVAAATVPHTPILDAIAILGFSGPQILRRAGLNRLRCGWDAIPPETELTAPSFLTPVRDFAGKKQALCPTFLLAGSFGTACHGDTSLNADSNGCATASSFDEAAAKAVLELVERDATGIWWWRMCRRDTLPFESIADRDLSQAVIEHRGGTGRHSWLLDISALATATVVAALSCEPDGSRVALGFGAAFDRRHAARSAFLEMLQTELTFDIHEVHIQDMPDGVAPTRRDRRLSAWLREVDIHRYPFLAGERQPADTATGAPMATFADLLDEIEAQTRQATWFFELPRRIEGMHTVKAVVPGLAHYKPRLGSSRLWTVVERLNLTTGNDDPNFRAIRLLDI